MSGIEIDIAFSNFRFFAYIDDDFIFVSDSKSPYEHGIEIPLEEIVLFRDELNKVIRHWNEAD